MPARGSLGIVWNLGALFTERFELAVPKTHPLAMRNSLLLSQLGDIRLLPRAYCEQSGALTAILSANGLSQDFQDRIASDHDLLALLAANVGVSLLPQSSMTSENLRLVQVQDLELTRPVVLYAVSGRQRSPAATGLLRLLRAANWPVILLLVMTSQVITSRAPSLSLLERAQSSQDLIDRHAAPEVSIDEARDDATVLIDDERRGRGE